MGPFVTQVTFLGYKTLNDNANRLNTWTLTYFIDIQNFVQTYANDHFRRYFQQLVLTTTNVNKLD